MTDIKKFDLCYPVGFANFGWQLNLSEQIKKEVNESLKMLRDELLKEINLLKLRILQIESILENQGCKLSEEWVDTEWNCDTINFK